MRFIEILKNICVCIVFLQVLIITGLLIIVAISDKAESDADRQGPHVGNRTFCLLTNKPCIYAENGGSTCDDCPAAQEHFYTEEKNVDKVRRFQDEGRADRLSEDH